MLTLPCPGRFTSSARRTGPLSVRRSPPERGPLSSHSLAVPFTGESRLLVRFGVVCPTSRLLKVYLSSSASLHGTAFTAMYLEPLVKTEALMQGQMIVGRVREMER